MSRMIAFAARRAVTHSATNAPRAGGSAAACIGHSSHTPFAAATSASSVRPLGSAGFRPLFSPSLSAPPSTVSARHLRRLSSSSQVHSRKRADGGEPAGPSKSRRFRTFADAVRDAHASREAALTEARAAAASHQLKEQLKSCLETDDSSRAKRLIREFEQAGGRPDVGMLNMWIGCHRTQGDWQGAERAWARFAGLGVNPTNVSYRTLMQVYTRAGGDRLTQIDPLLAEMQQSDVRLSVEDYERLIKTASHCHLHAEVRRWQGTAKAAGLFGQLDQASRRATSVPPAPTSSGKLQSAAVIAKPAASQSSVSRSVGIAALLNGSSAGASVAAASNTETIPRATVESPTIKSAMPEVAPETSDRRPRAQANRRKSEPTVPRIPVGDAAPAVAALRSQLMQCRRKGDAAGAEQRIRDFEQAGKRPDVAILNMWISCHQQRRDWEGAERVWARMRELQLTPDNISYRSLMQIYTEAGGEQLAKIDSLLSEIQQAGVQLSAKDYERLIKSAHRCQLPAEVRRWAQMARAAGVFDHLDEASRLAASQAPGITALRSQLSECVRAQQPATAEQLIREYEAHVGSLGVGEINQWIQCHEKERDWEGAERAWGGIATRNLTPDNYSYRSLMLVFTEAGGDQLAKIDSLLSEMQRSNVQLSVRDYEQLIKTANRCKLHAEVRRWGEMAHAVGLFDQLDEASRFAASQAPLRSQLMECVSAQQPANAVQLVREYEARGGVCDIGAMTQWLQCYTKSGDWQGAERVWAGIAARKLTPTNVSYRVLMEVYTSAGGDQLAKINVLLSEVQQSSVRFSVDDYQRLIKSSHRCKHPAEVRRWGALAREAGLFELMDHASRHICALPVNQRAFATSAPTPAGGEQLANAAVKPVAAQPWGSSPVCTADLKLLVGSLALVAAAAASTTETIPRVAVASPTIASSSLPQVSSDVPERAQSNRRKDKRTHTSIPLDRAASVSALRSQLVQRMATRPARKG